MKEITLTLTQQQSDALEKVAAGQGMDAQTYAQARFDDVLNSYVQQIFGDDIESIRQAVMDNPALLVDIKAVIEAKK